MNLKAYFCDYFELEITFSLSEFDKEAFLKDIESKDESKDTKKSKTQAERFSFVYGSQEHPGEQHAHLIVIFSDESCSAMLSYSRSRGEKVEDVRPPFMEDCSQWLGQFFKTETVVATIDASFDFGEHYTPVLVLPFPVMSEHEILAGTSITGVSLEFPEESTLDRVIIQRMDDSTWLSALGIVELKTAAMNAYAAFEEIVLPVNKLVKRTGAQNERSGERTLASSTGVAETEG
jgi:hypothetical protein